MLASRVGESFLSAEMPSMFHRKLAGLGWNGVPMVEHRGLLVGEDMKCVECPREEKYLKRGLCSRCYPRHYRAGTLDQFPSVFHKYTKEEDQKIISAYSTERRAERSTIAREIGVTPAQISGRARKLGFKNRQSLRPSKSNIDTLRVSRLIIFSEKETKDLFDRYRKFDGSIIQFAKSVHHSHRLLRRHFERDMPAEYGLLVEQKSASNKTYQRGRTFEYRVKNHLKKEGYWVLRSPRSGGPVDLVAIKKGKILFIQCKMDGYLSKQKRKELNELAESVGAQAILAYREMPSRALKFDSIAGRE